MTLFHLVRHARHTGPDDVLAGRTPGLHLSDAGRREAEALARYLAAQGVDAIHSSPRERAEETAKAIAAAAGIGRVIPEPMLDEVDFGSPWTGARFADLDQRHDWQRWNAERGLARTPGSERMIDLAARMLALIERLAAQYGAARLVLVSHAELIRAAVLHVLGLGADAWRRIEIAPASVTTILFGEGDTRLVTLNREVS